MRIRQVKPEFWSDPDMAELSPAVRLTYIGLWNIADDSGWFVADATYIGHELYGYDARSEREAAVADHLYELQAADRVHVLLCGHAVIPTLSEHQRQSAATRRVETVKREHQLCIAAESSGMQRNAAEFRPVKVEVSKGRVEVGRGSESPSDFAAKVTRPT